MTNPVVSIILPNYNHEHYLQERLNSIFTQTFQDFEVILLDDASTDGSLKILNSYKDHPKVSHFIVNENNTGTPFKQWITGINLAKGSYIWIAESDDVAHELFLETTVNFASQKKDLGLVFVTSKVIDGTGVLLSKIFKPKQKTTGFTISTKDEISKYLIKDLSILNASSVLFNAEILKDIDVAQLATFKNTGDRFTYIQVALRATVYFLDVPLNIYRSHNSNTTKKNRENKRLHMDRLQIVERVIPIFSPYQLASKNVRNFYFEQILILVRAGFLKPILRINIKMLLQGMLSFREFIELSLISFWVLIFNRKLPYRIKNYYERRFKHLHIFKK